MLIRKIHKKEFFERLIDAMSRVIIWVINHSRSPEISKLGLTKVADGFTNWNGSAIIHTGGPGIVAEINHIHENHQLPLGNLLCAQQKNFYNVFPQEMGRVLLDAGANIDWIYVAKKLNLFEQDADNISGPKLYRSFVDSLCTLGLLEADFTCYDSYGVFHSRYTIINDCVFELKAFKFRDRPEIFLLPFIPQGNAIYIPWNFNGIFTTDPVIARRNCLAGIGWIYKVGGAENTDWKIFEKKQITPQFLWIHFTDDSWCSKNNFAEVFALATEAKRRKIKFKIFQATANASGEDWIEAEAFELDESTIKQQAIKYKLKIDQVWIGLPGEIDFYENNSGTGGPFGALMQGCRVAECFGKRSTDFMLKLLEHLNNIIFGKILTIVPAEEQCLAKKTHQTGSNNVTVATYKVFDNKEVFSGDIPEKFSAVFVIYKNNDKRFSDVELSLCKETGLPVMIFSDREIAQLSGRDIAHCCIKKHRREENTFFVKCMETADIEKYHFSLLELKQSPAEETEMGKGE